MELFFGKRSGNSIVFDDDELNHILNVKRIPRGEIIHVTDGEGHLFDVRISDASKKNILSEIISEENFKPRPATLHIAVAPTKNTDRIEWLLEKATETGIEEITFIRCRHSERKEIKEERLFRILVSAIKQSMKTFSPKLNLLTDYTAFVSNCTEKNKLIFHTSAEIGNNLHSVYTAGQNLVALIGPEGDFHSEEIAFALQNGFKNCSLGSARLRTETAALAVCTIFSFLNQQ
jgi:16S rRNA (uracil1498-N3)-methyltransferase